MELIRRARPEALRVDALPEYEPISVVLKEEPDIATGKFAPQLALIWVTEDGTDTWIREWASLTLNQKPDGTPPALQEILTAVAGRNASDEVEWFNPETMEFSFDGTAVDGSIVSGVRIMLRGRYVAKDGKTFFKVVSHHPARTSLPSTAPEVPQVAQPRLVRRDRFLGDASA